MSNLPGALEDLELYLTYLPPEWHEAHLQKRNDPVENGKYLDAIQSFNRALELEKGKAEYYFARGRTYASTGTTRYADKDMSMALDLDPLTERSGLKRGNSSDKLGNRPRPCHCYQKPFNMVSSKQGNSSINICN